ncbi:GGDEF domain-containing protein [Roseateles saccharophilus]|uniref:PAS domain S-box-containing protein/diguanylate cyclase (GGDEF)-like protein n=1 Tax=Roseateles saccharophilus TaxID=304 RepID=A0A4R3UK26_ROSSA|nr:GGDEF domain-containing protein [Roseateles saccharophilus]TCU90663.1 PAS domain S-box-containing protein/diguanylate cyclase (GGDEF)-like protein [Roseateles saccharophilus]
MSAWTAPGLVALALLAVACCARARHRLARSWTTSLVFDHTDLGIIVTDTRANIVAVNPAYCRMSGYAAEELIDHNPRIQQSGRHDKAFYRELWRTLQASGQWQGEIWNRRRNGEAYPVWQNISAVRDSRGRVVQYLAVMSDITPVKAVQERLDHLAHHDALTGLPNRLHFMAALERSLAHADRERTSVALLFVDLDHFKSINDSFGHAVGDQLLAAVARRLQRTVRSEDMVARLGGDEFVVTLANLRERDEAVRIARKLLAELQEALDIDGQRLAPAASIGIALYPGDGGTPAELLAAADEAMYEAKRRGRHTFAFRPSPPS